MSIRKCETCIHGYYDGQDPPYTCYKHGMDTYGKPHKADDVCNGWKSKDGSEGVKRWKVLAAEWEIDLFGSNCYEGEDSDKEFDTFEEACAYIREFCAKGPYNVVRLEDRSKEKKK